MKVDIKHILTLLIIRSVAKFIEGGARIISQREDIKCINGEWKGWVSRYAPQKILILKLGPPRLC